MLKRFIVGLLLLGSYTLTYADVDKPRFVLVPNIKTTYLRSTNANQALAVEQQAIELTKRTLNITASSPYSVVRIRLIYNHQNKVNALIVYLLSSENKSVEIVRINVNNAFAVESVIQNYTIQPEDLKQSPHYATKAEPKCPDPTVQFVIGNNFTGDRSVEKEVLATYELAKAKGYNPFLMDTNNPSGPQPTIEAYENWLSCPNVKAFYNESHGWNAGIVLSDDELTYNHIKRDLVGKLDNKVVLFDSCETFHDPLLDSMINPAYANSQQYVAGWISLPFGPSERTATCIWAGAMNHQELTQDMVTDCARKNNLNPIGYKIAGNGEKYLSPATS